MNSKELGEKVLNECVKKLSESIIKVKETQSIEPFEEIYKKYDEKKKEIWSIRNLKGLFKSQGIGSKKEGIEFFKWWVLKRKKANPDYKYPKE